MDVGARLRQARESRGLTIEALAARTRIHARVLDALERNDLSVVPPHPYARGFVVTVAREVGLDPARTAHDYFAQFDTEPAVPHVSLQKSAASAEPSSPGWAPAVGTAMLVLVAALVWTRGTDAPDLRERGAIGTSGAGDLRRPADASPMDTVQPASRDPRARAGAPAPAGGPSRQAAGSREIVVVLEATAPSWVAAAVDGRREIYEILPAGTTRTLRGTREITLRVGNAGGLRWSVNGRPPEAMGVPGQVRDVRLTADR